MISFSWLLLDDYGFGISNTFKDGIKSTLPVLQVIGFIFTYTVAVESLDTKYMNLISSVEPI